MNEFGLKNYNRTIKSGSLDAELSSPHFLAYFSFLAKLDGEANFRLIQICSNGELYQRQKADLLTRAFRRRVKNDFDSRYVCVGHVSGPDTLELYAQREAYFRSAAVQRQMIADESLVESNLESLSLFSIVYDLLGSGHHKDVKLASIELDDVGQAKLSEQAAFVLYNCARLNAILDKFNSRVSQGRNEKSIWTTRLFYFIDLMLNSIESNNSKIYF